MICRSCQRDIADYSSFCSFCGTPQHAPSSGPTQTSKRLMRSTANRKIAGVCGGIAEYLDVDPTIVRLIWIFLVILPVPLVPAFLGYFVAWIVMPKATLNAPVSPQQPPVIIPDSPQTA